MATNPTDARLFIRKVFYTVARTATAFCRKKKPIHTQARIVVAPRAHAFGQLSFTLSCVSADFQTNKHQSGAHNIYRKKTIPFGTR